MLIMTWFSTLHCESESFKMDLILDVNIQVYPMDLGKAFIYYFIMTSIIGQIKLFANTQLVTNVH